MPETIEHEAPLGHPSHLGVRYDRNPDGWVTAQFVELPAAISQGRDVDEAWLNLLDALYDLAHEPTRAERLATALQVRLFEPLLSLLHR